MAGKPFFNGMTKTQLQQRVREIVNAQKFNMVFESPLISELIYTHHYYCSVVEIMPDAFMKSPRGGGGYDFHGRFDGRWHPVSWLCCIDKRADFYWIVRALRDASMPYVRSHKQAHPTCEVCGECPSQEVDHVSPEFKKIAEAAIAAMSPSQIEESIRKVDWWRDEAYTLPSDSPALKVLHEMHSTAVLQAVCRPCHLKNAAGRK